MRQDYYTLWSDEEIEKIGNQECIPLLEIYTQYNAYLRQNRLMDYDDQMVSPAVL